MLRDSLPPFLAQLIIQRPTRVVAIDGASALGKSTLAKNLAAMLPCARIGTDSYVIPRDERITTGVSPYDLRSRRIDELMRDVHALRKGQPIWLGDYNHQRGRNDPATLREPRPMLIVEGAHSFATNADLRIFLDASQAIMRAARRSRDERLGIADDHWQTRCQCTTTRIARSSSHDVRRPTSSSRSPKRKASRRSRGLHNATSTRTPPRAADAGQREEHLSRFRTKGSAE